MKISRETRYELDRIIDMVIAVTSNSDNYISLKVCSWGIDIYAMIGKYEIDKPWLLSKTFLSDISREDADEVIGVLTALAYNTNVEKSSAGQEKVE